MKHGYAIDANFNIGKIGTADTLKLNGSDVGGGSEYYGSDSIEINDANVISVKDGGITSDKIANEAITSDKLADNAVTADKIADDAVTTDKIADDAITSSKIVDGAITGDKIASNIFCIKDMFECEQYPFFHYSLKTSQRRNCIFNFKII